MLQDQNLRLRATTREDMRRQWEIENDPEIWYWDGGPPKPTKLETMFGYFDESVKDTGNDSASFSIEIDDNYVGHCSLSNVQQINRTCELAVEIGDKTYQGHGQIGHVLQVYFSITSVLC